MKAFFYLFWQIPFRKCALLMLLLGMASLGMCQTPQQHLYATGTGTSNPSVAVISGFDKNSVSGSLAAIPSSPFPAHNAAPMAVDGQGKFLFVAGPTSIAMYAIDSASGALTEVPRSPIPYIPIPGSEQAPSNPLSIATEPTGKFVYVGFQNGDFPGNPNGNSSITPYVIDTSNAALGPTLDLGPQWSLEFNAQPTNLFVEPSGRHLYAALGPYNDNLYAGFDVYDIDGNTGELYNLREVDSVGPLQVSAMDPKGRFLFQAYGEYNSWLSSFQLSPADGSITATTSIFVDYPMVHAMAMDPSGSFLYVNVGGAPPSFNTYSIDQTTGALTQLSSSTQIAYPFGLLTVADPQGAYLYTLLHGSVHGFQADPTSGTITELSGSPFTDGSANYYESGLYITNTDPQASSGPYLEISGGGPFPQTPVGTTSPQSITVNLKQHWRRHDVPQFCGDRRRFHAQFFGNKQLPERACSTSFVPSHALFHPGSHRRASGNAADHRQRSRQPAISIHFRSWDKQYDPAAGLFVLQQSGLWQPDAGYFGYSASNHADQHG